jgi:hypothetical protein
MQVHAHTLPADAGLFTPLVYGLASLWWLADVLQRHGPSLEAIGPILLGIAALMNARANLERARRGG